MELRQLEYFVAVAEEAGFTRAAARVHVAQPGVSAQIRRLERELGQELFDRSGRTVRLTEVGAAVLPYARAALDAVAGVRLAVDELTGLVRGRVAVGVVASSAALDLPDLLAGFHQRHPDVEITLCEANSDRLVESLLAGRLDIAFIGLGSTTPQGVETQVVADELLVAAVSHDHDLAARRAIPVTGLRDLPLISLPPGTGLRSRLDEACTAAGFQPRIAFEASDPQVLAQLAARGLGVAVLPNSLATARAAHLHAIRITHPELHGRLALSWRTTGPISPAARALIRHTRAMLGTAGRGE
ncbi:LysR family transcriptional regulator [Streptantibioticus rubrisoli]|uniref:LysR substrate-binding domain-containing protein n=1 Tax=Streptantibioticus rubrisoli TaxID=1387313 RepID=A0ABT1P752_9ACTN|nr:LysR substrate-binding domain-containing protein [Streptantibioticus rubrisoli]MCQ4041209.1 LysR substrate-binding domain-containing protein [Streptantibioticus rubrisoli]